MKNEKRKTWVTILGGGVGGVGGRITKATIPRGGGIFFLGGKCFIFQKIKTKTAQTGNVFDNLLKIIKIHRHL